MHPYLPVTTRSFLSALGLALGLASTASAQAPAGATPEAWRAGAWASAFYQCHFGARGQNSGSVMVWADARSRVVAMASPWADEPVPAWVRGPARPGDFNALFRTILFEAGERFLVADRTGRGVAMALNDRVAPCVRSVEE